MRECIKKFAEAMEAMMQEKAKEGKAGWDEMHGDELAELAGDHLDAALDAFEINNDKFLRQLIHAGNLAMMAFTKESR